MSGFEMAGALLAAVAFFGYINHRFIKLPDNIGNLAVGLLASLSFVFAAAQNPSAQASAVEFVKRLDFPEMVFHGMLGLLLFAGSLHVNFAKLRRQRIAVLLLATLGVVISTAVVGVTLHYALLLLGFNVAMKYCFIFGALISPTDPIAVMGVLKKAQVPESLEMRISGESLFNDGTGVVAFLLLLGLATGTAQPTAESIASMFVLEVGGGIVLGIALGFGAIALLKGMDSYPVEILTTLAVAVGGYALAERLHVSAPLAIVVAGLVIGNKGAKEATSETTRQHLFAFWELADEGLNLILFGLIGLQMVALSMHLEYLLAGAVAIPVVLLARACSVLLPLAILPKGGIGVGQGVAVLSWGGLRGGISVALALSLPQFEGQQLLVMATYCVVVFSLLVQGTTLGALIKKLRLGDTAAAEAPSH